MHTSVWLCMHALCTWRYRSSHRSCCSITIKMMPSPPFSLSVDLRCASSERESHSSHRADSCPPSNFAMETREEKLTEWADPSIVRTQRVRILTGSFSLIPSDSEKRVRISEENIQLDQIEEHISNTSRDNINDHNNENLWHFKAISFPRLKPGRLKLSMPKEIFQQIQHSWYLHPRTIEVFLSNNGVFTTFRCPTSGRSSLLLKVANSRSTGSDCISVTCCPTRRTINALYHNLDDETSAFATLLSTPECCIDPHFFVVALYRSHHQRIETHRNAIDDAIQAMERRSGLGNPGRLMFKNGRRASMEHYPVLEDPKSAIQQLSYCQTDLAIIGHVARCASDCGEWLVRVIDESLLDQQSPESLKAVRLTIRQEAEHIRKRTVMLLSQVQQMRDRAQSQTSLVSIAH